MFPLSQATLLLHQCINWFLYRLPMHLSLLWILLRHKYIVFCVGRQLGLPILQLVVHDWSKFTPSEWNGYIIKNSRKENPTSVTPEEEYCFLHHQNRNPHHLEYWITFDRNTGNVKPLKMPLHYVVEMVADWVAANRSYSNGSELLNQDRLQKYLQDQKSIIHKETKQDIHSQLLRLSQVFKFELSQEFSNFLDTEFKE